MRTFILIPLIYRHPRFPPIFLPAPKVAGKRGLTVYYFLFNEAKQIIYKMNTLNGVNVISPGFIQTPIVRGN